MFNSKEKNKFFLAYLQAAQRKVRNYIFPELYKSHKSQLSEKMKAIFNVISSDYFGYFAKCVLLV